MKRQLNRPRNRQDDWRQAGQTNGQASSREFEKNEGPWTEDELRQLFAGSEDVVVQPCKFGNGGQTDVVLVYAEGLCGTKEIGKTVLPELSVLYERQGGRLDPSEGLSGKLPVKPLGEESADRISETVFQGDLLMLFIGIGALYSLSLADKPVRQPEESNTEISVKGPRDGFVEDLTINIALIRKRLKSPSLHVETYSLGRRTKTRVALLYFADILNPNVLKEIRTRLKGIDIDSVISINQLEELLSDSTGWKLLPTMDFTGRPDFAVSGLLAGRFVLIIDGLPMVLIAPSGLSLILKSPEDVHFNYAYVSFSRIIRGLSLFLSIFLPAIWVALMSFHQDQIPFRLMATISVSRIGLPLSSHMEMFLLLTLLEIFREAGVRLPSAIGQTLTSIGGLIIGDAAIRAGLVSPSVVVVGAITAVSGVTLVNQTLSTQVSIFRLFFFLMASFFGLYGVILGFVLLIAYMGSLRSFGVGYLAPLSPLIIKDVLYSFLRAPWGLMTRRPSVLRDTDKDKTGEEDRS